MIPKGPHCSGCPLEHKGIDFFPDTLVPNPEYVFVGEAGKPLTSGNSGYVLKNWLLKAVPTLQVAYEQQKVSVCNTLRCLPPNIQGKAYPKGKERQVAELACSAYNQFGHARTVVLFGESAQRRWFGPELELEDREDRVLGRDVKGVMGRVGRVYERDGRRWVFAPHPSMILKMPVFVEHGQKALQIAVGVKVAEPECTTWV